MYPPHGFSNRYAHRVCRVNGSLYGLEPGTKIWHDHLSFQFRYLGLLQSEFDPRLSYHPQRRHLYITTYVDDFQVFATRSTGADRLINSLMNRLELKDLSSPEKYLGMEVSFGTRFVHLRQSAYTRKLVEGFQLTGTPPLNVPFDPNTLIGDHPDLALLKRYQHEVGSLQWLASHTRPDIARVALFLGHYNPHPTPKSFDLLLRVIQ